ncbi:bacteriohemerythrin [Motiliproteus sp. SC1-56]|uniref:bacteriohemerythrin n=1 Tax=Motiliproteus sp. SC1-56 TaxID=2799565 RepID=UPI001A8D7064|nr:bacteriohemerythrin [Motiliproteus sp. SC1-56]
MSVFAWSPALSVGNREIDQQHQELIKRINHLPSIDAPEFHDLIEHLLEYCFAHFEAEEHWMRTLGYPDYREHLSRHTQLGERFHDFFRDYVDGRVDYAGFRQFLFGWIKHHILEEDMKIAEFARNG